MKKFDIFSLAMRNFLRRKARSLLTITGVVIGTAAIVVMISIGNALNINSMKQLESWGSLTVITVYNSSGNSGYGYYDSSSSASGADSKAMNDSTLESFKNLAHVDDAMPWKSDQAIMICGKLQSWASLSICDASKLEEFDIEADTGRLVTKEDGTAVFAGFYAGQNFYDPKSNNYFSSGSSTVDMMNDDIQLTFDMNYGSTATEPVVDEITDGKGTVGTKQKLSDLKVTGMTAENSNNAWNVYMDLDAYRKLKREYLKSLQSTGDNSIQNQLKALNNYDYIQVKVDNIDNVQAVSDTLKNMGYQPNSMIDAVTQMQEQSKTIQLILGGIGAMSLLVAAIGIANTMIMSIYERTKEIGIMKVIGCKLSDIRSLFLCEAGIIGFTGGVAGVGLSYAISAIMNNFSDVFSSALGGTTGSYVDPSVTGETAKTLVSIIPLWLTFAAVGFALAVGLVSGFYPAWRAMRLSALDAIRNE